ncbi:MAG: hypothetical protein WDZ56_00180 [Candidatus Paceibacterota bacterium]
MVKKSLILAVIFTALPSMVLAQSTFLMPVPRQTTLSEVQNSQANIDMDLVVEANTYVPYFYQGRREPTAGSSARATALMLASNVTPASYLWQVGTQNFTTSTPYLDFVVPQISGDLRITATAIDGAGRRLGSKTESIRPSSPKTLFYENNALRGLSQIAIGQTLHLIGNEVSLRAEPYFFGRSDLLSSTTGNWSAEGVNVMTNEDWREVSLVRREGAGARSVNVRLDVRNRANLSESTFGTFKLSL